MQSGMLWFDKSTSKLLSQKIHDAQLRYQQRFGVIPNCIFINHLDAQEDDGVQFEITKLLIEREGGVLEVKETVLRNHFWMGVIQVGEPA